MDIVIDVVAGARPNFMKVAPLLRELSARAGPLRARLVHTGQHYDEGMSDVFLRQLEIPPPEIQLNSGSGSHGEQTARMLAGFERHLATASPRSSGVVVVGDVNSTLACSLAAAKLGIPVAHVEAGLRSFDRSMPEEINRVVTDAVADLLLVSEPSGVKNLEQEGVSPGRIRFVGNLMIDTLEHQRKAAEALDMPARLGLKTGEFALVTLHRPGNVDDPARLDTVLRFLAKVARTLPIVFPLHPRTERKLQEFRLLDRCQAIGGLRLMNTLGYRENLGLMMAARLVLTDSGGIQEETTFLGVPCLTLRPNTERPVTVTEGTNTVVGEDLGLAERLVSEIMAGRYKKGGPIEGWDGRAAGRVADALNEAWTRSPSSRRLP